MTETLSPEDKIHALKKQYIQSLAGKFSDIFQFWSLNKKNKEILDNSLESALHKLAGSAGMYDETALGEIARTLEISIATIDTSLSDKHISQIDSEMEKLKTKITELSS